MQGSSFQRPVLNLRTNISAPYSPGILFIFFLNYFTILFSALSILAHLVAIQKLTMNYSTFLCFNANACNAMWSLCSTIIINMQLCMNDMGAFLRSTNTPQIRFVLVSDKVIRFNDTTSAHMITLSYVIFSNYYWCRPVCVRCPCLSLCFIGCF